MKLAHTNPFAAALRFETKEKHMPKKFKQAWHSIAQGRLDREMQGLFEKAQRLAIQTGLKVPVTLTITVNPPRKGEPDYISVVYTKAIKEPVAKSKEYDLVLDMVEGIAVADAAPHPDQEALELGNNREGGNR